MVSGTEKKDSALCFLSADRKMFLGPCVSWIVMKQGLEKETVDSPVGAHLLECLSCNLRSCTCLQ